MITGHDKSLSLWKLPLFEKVWEKRVATMEKEQAKGAARPLAAPVSPIGHERSLGRQTSPLHHEGWLGDRHEHPIVSLCWRCRTKIPRPGNPTTGRAGVANRASSTDHLPT